MPRIDQRVSGSFAGCACRIMAVTATTTAAAVASCTVRPASSMARSLIAPWRVTSHRTNPNAAMVTPVAVTIQDPARVA
jgi:hypothetical protein